MNQGREKALLLLRQDRHELAERELHKLLADDPNDAWAHATLALCLDARGKLPQAEAAARRAIASDPDFSYPHEALAVVLARRGRLTDARRSAAEAIRLNPYDAGHRSLLSAIELGIERPADALREADAALSIDPRHVRSLNVRAAALIVLGRPTEARDTAARALETDPADDEAQGAMADALLHLGDAAGALDRYREALRLNPRSEAARAGFVRGLKARHRVYRWVLTILLWMDRRRVATRVGVVLILVFGRWIVEVVSRESPAAARFVVPVALLLVACLVLTWLADPLFTLLLRFDAVGRHVLTEPQRATSNYIWTLAVLLAAVVATAVAWPTGNGPIYVLLGGLIALPASVALAYRGVERGYLLRYVAGCAAAGAFVLVAHLFRSDAGTALGSLLYAAACGLSVVARPAGEPPNAG